MAKTKDFAEVIRRKLAADPGLADAVDQEATNANIAHAIHSARVECGLTQTELAKRIGTYQSVIARLENDDYDGHSLLLVRKIAAALGRRLTISMDKPSHRAEMAFGTDASWTTECVPLDWKRVQWRVTTTNK